MKLVTLTLFAIFGGCSSVSVDRATAEAHSFQCCLNHVSDLLPSGATPDHAVVSAGQHCRNGNGEELCEHFEEALRDAFAKLDPNMPLTPQSFCEASEAFAAAAPGATRVPNMGEGPMLGFRISPRCHATAAAAMERTGQVPSSEAPDFVYSLCVNQDCAHFVPSRMKWCNINHPPTHSVTVCEAARRFTIGKTGVPHGVCADEVCGTYAEFVHETGLNLEAYNHIMHGQAVSAEAVRFFPSPPAST